MELRNIKTFIHAAETESFTAAALREGYAQSTVTQQIQTLERELNAQLFIRSGRRVSLSSAGRELLRFARRMTALEQETSRNSTAQRNRQEVFSLASSRHWQRHAI